jgi:hypothetical protein
MFLLCAKKKLQLIHNSRSSFHRKTYICLLIQCHLCPIWPVLPLNLNFHFDISFATVMSDPAQYRLHTFHVPNLMPIFLNLGHFPKNLSKFEALCDILSQAYFLWWGLVSPTPNSQVKDHPLSAVWNCLFNIFAATPHIWSLSSPSSTWGRAMLWC